MSDKPVHPGTITFVSDDDRERVENASGVPESLRFAKNQHGRWVPVVRVVATVAGDQRTIREYGPGGELLRSTVQVKPPVE